MNEDIKPLRRSAVIVAARRHSKIWGEAALSGSNAKAATRDSMERARVLTDAVVALMFEILSSQLFRLEG